MRADGTPYLVLLTGASTGIGYALAKKLIAVNKYRVVLTARESSLERLQQEDFTHNKLVLLRALDVTSHVARQNLIDELNTEFNGVDILINNAGISFRAVVEHMTESDELLQHQTNYFGPMDLARLVIPKMRKRRWGRIINISSVGGMMAMPTMGSYSASKFALEGASEALWYELKPWNIAVTLIQPGFVHSKSFENVYWTEAGKQAVASGACYAEYYKHMGCFISSLMNKSLASPDTIADEVLRTIESNNPPLRVAATMDAWFFSALRRILPRRLYHWILYKNLPGIKEWGK